MYVVRTDVANRDTNEVVPQVQHMGTGYDWDAPDALTTIAANVPLDCPPDLDSFHLAPETRFTDVLSQSYIPAKGLLVSERLKSLLGGFVVQSHEAWPGRVTLGTETRPYWWLHLTEELEARVDYAASSFNIETPAGPGVDATVSSRDELDGIARRLVDSLSGMLTPRRVTFAPGTPAYDFFCLQVMARSFYASERLADRLSSADVTGIELAPSDIEFLFPPRE